MAEQPQTGLLDLGKELTCSICTEVLYQPLTLLDCLHTFCGSCLKLWFSLQASRAESVHANPYTCPSCRAEVRGTRPDAKITTLLEMFLQAYPDKARTEEEKKEMQDKYRPGENVVPRLSRLSRREHETDEADRRMVEEARHLSLQDRTARSHRGYERGVRHRQRSRESRSQRTSPHERSPSGPGTGSSDARSQARQLEHQSSLRSLISADDVDAAEMEEEILRQIFEEGLLDGIDLHNMSVSQEDELSERIAEAYRRRHRRSRSRSRSVSRSTERHSGGSRNWGSDARSTPPAGPSSPNTRNSPGAGTALSHPPVSSSRLLEAYPTGQGHRHRTSSEGRRQTSPIPRSTPVQETAVRSSTDLSRPNTDSARERRPSDLAARGRRGTEPEPRRRRASGGISRSDVSMTQTGASRVRGSPGHDRPSPTSATPTNASPPPSRTARPLTGSPRQSHTANDEPRTPNSQQTRIPSHPRTSSSPQTPNRAQQQPLYVEPSINCDRCGRQSIQYDLHEYCSICNNGNFNICHRCYRQGKGCNNWFGFGEYGWHRFQLRAASHRELPHTLIGHQYLRPRAGSVQPGSSADGRTMTTDEPINRLLSGAFCSVCHSFADDCFWKCEHCNDGEWGYCNNCVNQGRCCVHPLLPVAHISVSKLRVNGITSDSHSGASFAPLTSPTMVQTWPPSNLTAPGQYRPLVFTTNCDVCRSIIPASHCRYHCFVCSGGNYDICFPCYAKLEDYGRISAENGERGWRRCPRGHRTIVFNFEESSLGQLRTIVRDLVGGRFLDEDEMGSLATNTTTGANTASETEWKWQESGERRTKKISRQLFLDSRHGGGQGGARANAAGASNGSPRAAQATTTLAPAPSAVQRQFPPDGGVGSSVVATHAWIPEEGTMDELGFPRGAEIREVMEVTKDWYIGSYAGSKGVFPSNFVRSDVIVSSSLG